MTLPYLIFPCCQTNPSAAGGGGGGRPSGYAETPSAARNSRVSGNSVESSTTAAAAATTTNTPPTAHEAKIASNPSSTTANTPTDGTLSVVHTAKSHPSSSNLLLVKKAISKLETLIVIVKGTHAWTEDRNQGGGASEFRAPVVEKKLEVLFHRCEDAHAEADAVTEEFVRNPSQ